MNLFEAGSVMLGLLEVTGSEEERTAHYVVSASRQGTAHLADICEKPELEHEAPAVVCHKYILPCSLKVTLTFVAMKFRRVLVMYEHSATGFRQTDAHLTNHESLPRIA